MDDLIAEFITETNESIGELDSEIVRLEQNPNDMNLLNSIFRLMHTIKGTCGFLGLDRLQKVAHSGENVLDKMRNKELEVTSEGVTLILECIDNIKGILAALEETGSEPAGDDSVIIKKLDIFAEGGASAAVVLPAAEIIVEEVVESGVEEFEPVAVSEDDLAEQEALKAMQEQAEVEEIIVPAEEVGASDSDIFPEDEFVPVPADMTGMGMEVTAFVPKPEIEEVVKEETKKVAFEEGIQISKKAPVAEHGDSKQVSTNASIRVNVDTLENLMQLVSELVLTRNQMMQLLRTSNQVNAEYAAPFQRLSLITSDLQEGVMKTRMQPIGTAWSKLPRIIRDLSVELGKKIDLKMTGEDTELDRQMLELVKDPLTHMVRNSADHGIEMPAARAAAGKSETGTVHLSAFHEGGHIIVQIKDDGKGIDPIVIGNKAVEKGLATRAEVDQMDERQIFQFIFAAGFSTAEKVTSVSGRGVGMDVVRTNVEKMGGSIDLDSVKGEGSTFQMKIPLTLAIMPVLIMESGNERFAIPQINVVELVRVGRGDDGYKVETVNGSAVLRLRGRLLPLINLAGALGLQPEDAVDEKKLRDGYIVVCELGNITYGLIVDKIFDTEEIVVKPVSSALRMITVYSGSTILGDGSVIMILDPNGLAKTINIRAQKSNEFAHEVKVSEEDKPVTFLTFKAGDGAPKAVPLELVARLEDLNIDEVEKAGGLDVMQYRGDLMRLMRVDESYDYHAAAKAGKKHNIIVFANGKKVLGLVVEKIIDIVDEKVDISMDSTGAIYFGSMVIHGKTADIVNVSHLFEQAFSDWGSVDVSKAVKQSKGRILLVEDSPFFRKLMVPTLASRGYEVKTAVNGLEAINLLQKDSNFKLIVTDIDMPEMNGIEFGRACKADPKLQHIPIVAMTANVRDDIKLEAKKVGLAEYISKSDREKLFNTMIEIVEGEQLATK